MNICKDCVLKSCAARKLKGEETEILSQNSVSVKIQKGDCIIKQGMLSSNIAYLRKGIAKIHIKGPHYEQIIKLVKAPCYLALPTTFGNKVNQYSATAIEDVEVCFVDINTFKEFLGKNEQFSYEIILEICKNELESFCKCANRTQKQIHGNIADVLLELTDRIYQSDEFTIAISRTEFGNLIDASRESVSRVLAEFDNDGLIRISGKNIVILNKKSLQLISKNG